MPLLCRLTDSLVVWLWIDDHPWPHVHVRYAEHQAVLRLKDLAITEGRLPAAQRRALLKWAAGRQAELLRAWSQAERHEPVERIDRE